MSLPAAVAAGHPDTAEVGRAVLEAGGTAVDAAVAAVLASCTAETMMTGLLGGGHALVWDGQRVWFVDGFVAVPGLGRPADAPPAPLRSLDVPFADTLIRYDVGIGTVGVPGTPALCDLLWQRWGSLPWPEVVAPARALAEAGTVMGEGHAACLRMLEGVMLLPGYRHADGSLRGTGDRVVLPGLVTALDVMADEGGASAYRGSIAEALLQLVLDEGGALTRDDLDAYAAVAKPAGPALRRGGLDWLPRPGLGGIAQAMAALPVLSGVDPATRGRALVAALGTDVPQDVGETTNLVCVDAQGRACVVTTSLGIGSGDVVPGFDLHCNSMLGEVDLRVIDAAPGARMGSMMTPTLVADAEGPVAVAGAAGGGRIRSALVQSLVALCDDGLEPQAAVSRHRLHAVAGRVDAEPDVPEPLLAALAADGWPIRRWGGAHHYFGGVSLVARGGPAADPRRSGAALRVGPGAR